MDITIIRYYIIMSRASSVVGYKERVTICNKFRDDLQILESIIVII